MIVRHIKKFTRYMLPTLIRNDTAAVVKKCQKS